MKFQGLRLRQLDHDGLGDAGILQRRRRLPVTAALAAFEAEVARLGDAEGEDVPALAAGAGSASGAGRRLVQEPAALGSLVDLAGASRHQNFLSVASSCRHSSKKEIDLSSRPAGKQTGEGNPGTPPLRVAGT